MSAFPSNILLIFVFNIIKQRAVQVGFAANIPDIGLTTYGLAGDCLHSDPHLFQDAKILTKNELPIVYDTYNLHLNKSFG